jgi:Spy/CpxP family protein refolding chaperone
MPDAGCARSAAPNAPDRCGAGRGGSAARSWVPAATRVAWASPDGLGVTVDDGTATGWTSGGTFRAGGRADFAGPGPREGVAADMMLRRASALELTQDQIGKLEGLAAETKKKLIDLRAEMEKSRLDMRSLLRSESEDLAQVKKQMGALSKARADMQEARITHLFEARKVLTAEQKKMVKEKFPRMGWSID